jgi:hypothetical protein
MIFMVQAWAEAAWAQGRELTLYFSDFKGAFTSLSHKAIYAALEEARASPKIWRVGGAPCLAIDPAVSAAILAR